MGKIACVIEGFGISSIVISGPGSADPSSFPVSRDYQFHRQAHTHMNSPKFFVSFLNIAVLFRNDDFVKERSKSIPKLLSP